MVANFRLELNVDVVIEQVVGVARWLCQAAEKGSAAHEVERTIFQTVLEMGQRLFGGYLRMAGDGDLGEQVTLPDGRVVQRLEDAHERRLQTVFGEFSLSRRVSGTEERKVIELIPTDQRLQLPEGKVSYLLQEWDQLLGLSRLTAGSATRSTAFCGSSNRWIPWNMARGRWPNRPRHFASSSRLPNPTRKGSF